MFLSPKALLVIQREYLTRVTKRSFWLITFLGPVLMSLLLFIPIIVSIVTSDSQAVDITVIDKNGTTSKHLLKTVNENLQFRLSNAPLEKLLEDIKTQKNMAVLVLPEDESKLLLSPTLYASKDLGLMVTSRITRQLEQIYRDRKLISLGVASDRLDETNVQVSLHSKKITTSGEEKTNAALGYLLGNAMAFLNYIMVAIYGTMVMRGVMEEKINRIVEVMVSSVRPFDLMIGKLIGIGAVGLTQFTLWAVLIGVLLVISGLLMAALGLSSPSDTSELAMPRGNQQMIANQVMEAISGFKVSLIFYFLFFFIGGFLLFGSLYAALGASVDQESDAQQSGLATIISIPFILPMLFISAILNNPSGGLAVILSYIPFFTPTVMMARLASTDVPWWEVILACLVLVAGILGAVWVSARIYRTGILMYGKKITLKEIYRWVMTG